MKILFFGSSEYCLPILQALQHFQLIGIITRTTSTTIKQFALSHNIKIFTPKNKQELLEIKDNLSKLDPDIAVVADYGLIIPAEIFTIPKYKTLNIHFSKLPKLRGASPVQFTLLLGEKSAWTTVIIMDETMDTGDIIWQKKYPLSENETTGSLYKKLFNNVASELPDIIYQYAANKFKPQKQNHKEATYTKILTREDGFISPKLLECSVNNIPPTDSLLQEWKLSKLLSGQLTINNYQLSIERALRALSPWPGLWTIIKIKDQKSRPKADQPLAENIKNEKRRLKILKAHLQLPASQGLTLRGYHDQRLILDLVQLEGKNPVSWKQFVEGYPL